MALAQKGIDVRQTGTHLAFRALLQDSSGALVTTGTTSLYLYELQSDGTLKSYDWNDNTFKTTALTTETQSMTHRTGNNSTTNTGLWTYVLTTVSGFTAGGIYFARVKNTGASPTDQTREFQYGSEQGDLVVTSGGFLEADVQTIKTQTVTCSAGVTVNANVGTTQPTNFTGTGASALVKADMVDVAGAAVSTSTAQLGVNAVDIGGTAQTGRDLGSSVLISSGTGTGQLDVTSGVIKANLAQILGTALTETAGQIAAAFKKFFNVASPTSTMDSLTLVATATNVTNAPPDSSGVTTLLTRIPSALFSGITSLAQWLGMLAGKQTGNSTARTEIRATGAGSGTFDETTDSQEALRDRGDAAWVTATGFSTLDAAGVRSAVGLASANLDTQIGTLATASSLASLVTTVGVAGAGLTGIPKTGFKLASDGLNLIVPPDPVSTQPVIGTANLETWIGYFGACSVNKFDSNASEANLYATDGTTPLSTFPHSDDLTTFVSGPGT